MSRTRMITCGVLLVGSVGCWFFPLFHIRPLDKDETTNNSSQHVNKTPATEEPVELEAYAKSSNQVTQLWNAFDSDAAGAKEQYGRQAGLGGAWYFCVRGQGTVEVVEKDRVVLTVTDSSRRVCLELSVVVDNTVREAVGVKASDFANSQEFNAVSAELNRRVEEEVISPNRTLLIVGAVVDFVGCAKIGGKSDLDPLCLIPIQLRIRGSDRGVGFQPADQSRGSSGKLTASFPGASP